MSLAATKGLVLQFRCIAQTIVARNDWSLKNKSHRWGFNMSEPRCFVAVQHVRRPRLASNLPSPISAVTNSK
jgi:hypothetical protein